MKWRKAAARIAEQPAEAGLAQPLDHIGAAVLAARGELIETPGMHFPEADADAGEDGGDADMNDRRDGRCGSVREAEGRAAITR